MRLNREFNLTVRVAAGRQPVDAASVYLDYDPALLQVVSMTLPLVLQQSQDNAVGHLDFSAGTLETPPSGNFTLVTIRFRPLVAVNDVPIMFALGSELRQTNAAYRGESVLGAEEAASVSVIP